MWGPRRAARAVFWTVAVVVRAPHAPTIPSVWSGRAALYVARCLAAMLSF